VAVREPAPAYRPPVYDIADAYAIKATAIGEATPDQQRRAMRWIVEQAAANYEWGFQAEGPRETDVLLGRQFVGRQLVKIINLSGDALAAMQAKAGNLGASREQG